MCFVFWGNITCFTFELIDSEIEIELEWEEEEEKGWMERRRVQMVVCLHSVKLQN